MPEAKDRDSDQEQEQGGREELGDQKENVDSWGISLGRTICTVTSMLYPSNEASQP